MSLPDSPNILIVTGEISGDATGGALAVELSARFPHALLWGSGSSRMREAGVELLFDSSEWSAIGVVEALGVIPRLRFHVYPKLIAEMERRKPDLAILIDFGAFNTRFAAQCKRIGVPVLYYFPPGSWRKEGATGANLVALTDRIATPFPWSAERLRSVGANVEFVGHPLLDRVKPTQTRAAFCDSYGMEPGHPIVGLLPGSRGFEVKYNTPAMLSAAQRITSELPNTQFVFGVASQSARIGIEEAIDHHRSLLAENPPANLADRIREARATDQRSLQPQMLTPEGFTVTPDSMKLKPKAYQPAQVSQHLPSIVLAESKTYDVMAHSDFLMCCSGTATLEAAVLGTAMVILYRGSRLMELEYRLRRVNRVPFIGMPNIIAGKLIVPERIANAADPETLANDALRMLRDPAARAQTKADLLMVREVLGEPGASARVAAMAEEMLRR